MALTFEMILWHQLLSHERVATVAERLQRVTEEQEFALLRAFAYVGQGWAACQRGELAAGTARIEKGLELQEATGAQLVRRYMCVYLVEAHLAAGRPAEGLAALGRILVRPEGRLGAYLDSELYRLEGELLRASGDVQAAEASLRKALGIARDQGARAFELRAAASLGRLLAEQGRVEEARVPLAAVYQTYTEGFETRDLQDARELLDRLTSGQPDP
jgi:predicted ATPase